MYGLSVEAKDVEDLKDDPGVDGDMATSAQAGGDGAEVGMAVGVEMDELGSEYEAVGAPRLAERLELGELAGGALSAGARAERQLSALSAESRARTPSHFTSYPRGVRGDGKRSGARQHRRDESRKLLARHRHIKPKGVLGDR